MFDAEDVYLATKALRPHLDRMLGEQRASPLIKEIDELLQFADHGQEVDNLILDLLTQDPDIRSWLKTALLDETTRGLTRDSGYESLPGNPGKVRSLRFICPLEDGHFEWCLRRVGRPVPVCPIHRVSLVLTSEGC